jgi:hypothetical protein
MVLSLGSRILGDLKSTMNLGSRNRGELDNRTTLGRERIMIVMIASTSILGDLNSNSTLGLREQTQEVLVILQSSLLPLGGNAMEESI